MPQEYRKTAVLTDFTLPTTVALVTGTYLDIATMKTPAQQLRAFGFGAIENGVDDRGVYKLAVNTSAPAQIAGSSRLVVRDANGVVNQFVREDSSNDLASTTSLGTGVRVPRGGLYNNGKGGWFAKQDSFLVIQFNPTTSATATLANCLAQVPLTIIAL